MITRLGAYYDRSDNFYFINVTTGGYGITVDEQLIGYPFLCALLNSRLLDFHLRQVSTNFHGGYLAANKQYIEQLPIRLIDDNDRANVKRHDCIVALAEGMLQLHTSLAKANTPEDKKLLQRQIDATDKQIDQFVYELYGLSDDEIKIVEGATQG